MYALVIFTVALMLRLIHVWQIKPSPFFDVLMGDANGYDQWAQRLAAGDWVGTEVFYQAPLYPYFLGVIYALFDRDLLIVRVIQAVVGSASCVLLGLAAARLFSPRAGLIAGLGLALWAPAIFFDGLLQKSVLDMFFMCLSLWIVSTIIAPGASNAAPGPRFFALGAALAAFALTRENGLLLIGMSALTIVLRWFSDRSTSVLRTKDTIVEPASNDRRTLVEPFLAFVTGVVLVFLPVVARNYAVDGGIYLTTSQFGSNLYIGNNPNADGTYASIRFGRGSPEFERLDATEVAQEAAGRALSPAEVSSFWTERALDYITSQPLDWLRLTARKVLLLVNRSEMIDTEAQESYAEYSLPLRALGWFGHFGVLVPLATLGVIVSWPQRRRLRIIYALPIAYAASVVMFFVFARYRYPLVPWLLLVAALPFDASAREPLAGLLSRGPRRLLVAAALVAAIALANWPLLSPSLMMAITENNLGTALQDHRRYDEAIAHHDRAIAMRPDYAPAYNNRGAALRAAGRLDEAVASYRKALELKPDFASASYNLANALLEQGKSSDSAESFRRALRDNPASVEAHNNLGIALAQKGDVNGAIEAFQTALKIDERSVHAHRNLGNLLFDLGRRSEAVRHLERAIELAPSEPDAVYDLGTILLTEQRFAPAAQRFEAALRIRPDWPEAHNNLGIALASQGRLAEALHHFERAVALNPAMADARANRDQARSALRK